MHLNVLALLTRGDPCNLHNDFKQKPFKGNGSLCEVVDKSLQGRMIGGGASTQLKHLYSLIIHSDAAIRLH